MRRYGGDFDYDAHGADYSAARRPDSRIAARIHAALGDARTVLNVGAGAGSYEPGDRWVLAVEPSRIMRAQRRPTSAPAIAAYAEALPLDDDAVDAAMASITVHQWSDARRGLAELRRVARGPVVVLTFDGDALPQFWLNDYAPEMIAAERRRFPSISEIAQALGSRATVEALPVPIDCSDGFIEAFYARPEALLQAAVRRGQSAWGFVSDEAIAAFEARLKADLTSGVWDARYGDWRRRPHYDGALRLVTGWP